MDRRWISLGGWQRAAYAKGALQVLAVLLVLVGVLAVPARTAGASTERLSRLSNTEIPAIANGVLRPAASRSALPSSMVVTLTLNRTDQSGFNSYLSEVQKPTSKDFRHFLTQSQLAARYGPSPAVYDQVVSWLRSQGFSIVDGSTNRLTITARGTEHQVDSAFGTWIDTYQNGKRTFYANSIPVSLPTSVASDVQSVAGLSDLGLPSRAAPVDENEPACPAGSGTATSSNGGDCGANASGKCADYEMWAEVYKFGGDYFKFLYDLNQLKAAAAGCIVDPPAVASQKIGLLEFDNFNQSDVSAFENLYGLTQSSISEVNVDGGAGNPGAGESEVLLDADLVSTFAPGASVVVYDGPTSASFESMFNAMINDEDTIISNSWSACEDEISQSEAQAIDSILAQAAASGISVFNFVGRYRFDLSRWHSKYRWCAR